MDNYNTNRRNPVNIPITGVTDIVSLPSSVRQRLDNAVGFMGQGRMDDARNMIAQAGAELARTNPEILLLLYAMQNGTRGIEVEEIVTDTNEVVTPRRFMGFRLEDDVTITTNTHATRRRIRLV